MKNIGNRIVYDDPVEVFGIIWNLIVGRKSLYILRGVTRFIDVFHATARQLR